MHAPNVITRSTLHRRTLLKAAGVALALPLLDAMCPALTSAADQAGARSPRRFVGILTNQGIMPDFFFPKEAGKDYASTPYLDLLKDHRAQMTVFSGVSLPGVDGGHASERCFLSAAPGASRASFRNTVSLDQVMAEHVGGDTRFASLVLMAGSENSSISFTRSGAMIPPIRSPVQLYQRLFIEDTPEAKKAAHERLAQDRSLLDSLRERTRALEKGLGPDDKRMLDQYFAAIRDLETRLAAAENWVERPKPKTEAKKPEDVTDSNKLITHSKVMYALTRLALETDSTRVVSFMINPTSCVPREIPGVGSQVHEITHHGNRENVVAELRKVEEAQFRELNTFLTDLRSVPQEGGTLLDRTAVLYGTNMGSANAHSNDNLPVLLAGGGFKHGQHLAFDRKNNYPLTNLHVSLLQRLGVPLDRFVSSTGTMLGLEMA
jgi:hypothetical protein